MVLSIFHTLSGVSWPNASSIFLALKSDHDRRATTLALMDQVLNTANDRPIRDQGAQLLGQLGNLGYEGTVATHTMWVTVIRQRKVSPQPDLPEPPSILRRTSSLSSQNLRRTCVYFVNSCSIIRRSACT